MIILSFDIGIKNLAYCKLKFNNKTDMNHDILDWNIINCAEDIISKNLKCSVIRKGNICGKDAVEKIIDNNLEKGFCKLKTCQKYLYKNCDIKKKKIIKIKKISVNKIPLSELGNILYFYLDKIMINDIDLILVENQPALKNPTMKSIQMMLFSFFVFKKNYSNANYQIEFFNASKKLKIYDGPKVDTEHLKNKYNKRKYLAIKYTSYLLKKNNTEYITFFENNQKKDDLADSYLQGITFYYK